MDVIIVDAEYVSLLDDFVKAMPNIPLIIDLDTEVKDGRESGPFDEAVIEGWAYDEKSGGQGWEGLEHHAADEEEVMCLAYTSGTTARPKGVEYTHRGIYLAAMGNIIESGLNASLPRCKYLWTLPMFHAVGKVCFDIITGKTY